MFKWFKNTFGTQQKEQAPAQVGAAQAVKDEGNRFLDAENYEEAERCYRKALEIDPNYPQAHHNLGLALKYLRRMDDAKAAFEAALALDPSLDRSWYHLATLTMAQGDSKKAIDLFRRALAIDPEFSTCYQDLALVQHSTGDAQGAEMTLRQALLFLPEYGPLFIDLGNVCINMGRNREAVEAYAAGFAKIEPVDEPWYWDSRCNFAVAMSGAGQLNEAEKILREALDKYPTSVKVLVNLAVVLIDKKLYQEAADLLQRAIVEDPTHIDAMNNYGFAMQKLGSLDDAISCYQQILLLNPDAAVARCNLGTAFQELNRLDEAMAEFCKAVEIDPEYSAARFDRALLRLMHGDFTGGWQDYEARWKLPKQEPYLRGFSQPLWLGDQDIAGKTLLVHAEQGYGDIIQFIRFVEPLSKLGAKIIVEVSPPLLTLCANMSFISSVAKLIKRGDELGEFDFHCPMMSLPLACKMTSLDDIPCKHPYVNPERARALYWQDELAGRTKKVGIVWSGNPDNSNDKNRSVRLVDFAPVFDGRTANFVVLQKDVRASDREHLPVGPNVLDVGQHLTSFAETAAVIANLDLVITVDSAVAHLAGAMGKPVWVLIPLIPDFRWLLDRDDSPWYPSARLYRQTVAGDWGPVIARIRHDLSNLV